MSGEAATVQPCDIGATAWDSYVAAHADASGYHRWRWRRVFEDAFGHETRYLAVTRHERVVGVLPLVLFRSRLFGRFAVSLPFVNYGGVLADDDQAAAALLHAADEIVTRSGCEHLELRHRAQRFPALVPKRHKVAMLLDLASDTDTAWNALDRKVRNQIRKAEKSGLEATAGGAERLDDFYEIFARNMRDLGTPVYSRAFFDHVLRACGDDAKVVIVSRGTSPVAAGIVLAHASTAEVPWASSLTDARAWCPNHALYWFVIRWAIERRFARLDFGRSTPNEGTFHFKRQWGAEPSPLCWEYRLARRTALPDQSPKNPAFQPAIAMWKRAPLWLTNRLGPLIVRSIP